MKPDAVHEGHIICKKCGAGFANEEWMNTRNLRCPECRSLSLIALVRQPNGHYVEERK